MKLEYTGFLKDGKLHIMNRKLMDLELPVYFKEGKELEITIERKFSKRTTQSNRYYWLLITMIAERFRELGNDCTKDDIHCFMRSKFCFKEILKDDEVLQLPKSTTELTKSEMSEYIEKIKIFSATSLDLNLPEPNQQLEWKLNTYQNQQTHRF